MGLHDVETMNEIRKAVNKVDPTIIIYGEPWWAAQPQLRIINKRYRKHVSDDTSRIQR